MWRYTTRWPCVVVVVVVVVAGNRQTTESDESTSDSMVRLVFRLWLAESCFNLSQRQATSKVSIGIFVRFPLASSAGRSVHTAGALPPATTLRTKKGYTNSQVGMVLDWHARFAGFQFASQTLEMGCNLVISPACCNYPRSSPDFIKRSNAVLIATTTRRR